jgi:hypothetical protein
VRGAPSAGVARREGIMHGRPALASSAPRTNEHTRNSVGVEAEAPLRRRRSSADHVGLELPELRDGRDAWLPGVAVVGRAGSRWCSEWAITAVAAAKTRAFIGHARRACCSPFRR